MSFSGVLLNHPRLIDNMAVPHFLVPDNYQPNNWNRSTLKGIVDPKHIKKDSLILYGNQGIFTASKDLKNIKPFMNGDFPNTPRQKRTNHVFSDKKYDRLLAATNKGLFYYRSKYNTWQELELPLLNEPVKKILQLPNELIVVTASAFYISPHTDRLKFEKCIPQKKVVDTTIPLITVFFELHDGSIWGLPGKLIWDIAGIILFFLCISAFYIWYYPKKWKRNYKRKRKQIPISQKRKRSLLLKYHKKLGWYFTLPLIVIFVTGMFLRPPLLMGIVEGKIHKNWYPSIENRNPWNHKIRNAFYDSKGQQLILDCKDGIWSGGLQQGFEKQKFPIQVFAMGATVFEEEQPGTWLIGSFGGLQRFYPESNNVESVLPLGSSTKQGRPSSLLVTSFIQLPGKKEFVLGHYKGLCNLKGQPVPKALEMPHFIVKDYKMPLWNFLFELHNARIFRGWIGGAYMLVVPLGALLSLLILISGLYDYLITRKKKKR